MNIIMAYKNLYFVNVASLIWQWDIIVSTHVWQNKHLKGVNMTRKQTDKSKHLLALYIETSWWLFSDLHIANISRW